MLGAFPSRTSKLTCGRRSLLSTRPNCDSNFCSLHHSDVNVKGFSEDKMVTSREASAALSSGDTIDDQVDVEQPEDIKAEPIEPVVDDAPTPERPAIRTPGTGRRGGRPKGSGSIGRKAKPKRGTHIWINEGPQDGTEDEGSVVSVSHSRGGKKGEASPDAELKTVGTAVGTRRQANGTVGSVYSGSKIRHIKKPDGTPLWRKEIQYEFLRLVIEDDTRVFTRISDGKTGCNFADIYIDCMARSSKTSKILKDRLQVDRQAAQNMAMICLLVNVGRMNTTLNFFPEMRAQLRTYHSIPSLQAYKSQRDYKSLQDAPRLKSILKGASEDTDEPRNIAAVKARPVPRTNPVNLIFVISQFAPKASELHFTDKVDFFDLAMRPTISSKSRARAFLWLMWWYLESHFTKEDALNNPFGPGEYKEGDDPEDPTVVPQLVPKLVTISPEEGDAENVDPEEEVLFAEKMSKERKRIMAEVANEPPPADPANPDHKLVKRLKKKSAGLYGDDDSMVSDADSRASPGIGRSPAPDTLAHHGHVMTASGGQADSLDDEWEAVDPHPGRGRYKRVRGKNTPSRGRGGRHSDGPRSLLKARQGGTPDTVDRFRSTPQPLQPGGGNHPVISQFGTHRGRHDTDALGGRAGHETSGASGTGTKARARTGYQRELEEHRIRRIEWALKKRRREALRQARQLRERGRWLLKTARRVSELQATYDSEEGEEVNGAPGFGGLLGRRWTGEKLEGESDGVPAGFEEDDYGEEAEAWLKVFKRTRRRLEAWSGDKELAIYHATVQRQQPRAATYRPSTKDSRLQDSRLSGPSPLANVKAADLNEEITQDLLAERSDEEMGDDESVDGGEGDVEAGGEAEESDVDMD